MNKNKKGFTLVELLVVIGILGILMGALFPAISSAMVKANLSACGMRGRNLFVAITSAGLASSIRGSFAAVLVRLSALDLIPGAIRPPWKTPFPSTTPKVVALPKSTVMTGPP